MKTSNMLLLMSFLAAGGVFFLVGDATGMVTGGNLCQSCSSIAVAAPIMIIGFLLFGGSMMISWKIVKI